MSSTDTFVFPLSLAQQGLWLSAQIDPRSADYNIPQRSSIRGPLNVAALRQAIETIVSRHEALRTSFPLRGGRPVQAVASVTPVPFDTIDLRAVVDSAAQAERLALREARQPFDITAGPLLRVTLLRLADRYHHLLLVAHHLVADGWSMDVLLHELSALYGAYAGGHPSPLPDLPIQYADFAHWQREQLDGPALQAEVDFWKHTLAGAPMALDLPTDRPRPSVPTFDGAQHSLILPTRLTDQVKALSEREGCTLYVTLLAAFQALLGRYTGWPDLLIGTLMANRPRPETASLIGLFTNLVVVRANLAGNPSFRELMLRARTAALDSHAHQGLPFEKLVEEIQPPRSPSRHPLVEVVFALQRSTTCTLEGLEVEVETLANGASKFDLTMTAVLGSASLTAILTYNPALFDAATAARIGRDYQHLLEHVVSDPGRRLRELHGGIDQRSCPVAPAPGLSGPVDLEVPVDFVAPQTPLERAVADVWRSVLQADEIGVHDNFFDLGGHSLLMIEVQRRLVELVQREVPVVELFKYPTVAMLVRYLSEGDDGTPSIEHHRNRARLRGDRLAHQYDRRQA